MRLKTILILIIAVALFVPQSESAEPSDWPSWRGPLQNGTSPLTGLISSWSTAGDHLIWRADFMGRSTPIVMNGRVYVIGRTGQGPTMQEVVACYDAGNGKKLWEKKFNVYLTTVPFTRVGWASLVGDPETGNVYMQGVGGLLVAFDRDGKVLWRRSMGEEFGRISGYGGRIDSPLVDEDLVITNFVSSAWGSTMVPRHRYFAFDKRTGELVWQAAPGGRPHDNVYSTPVVAIINGVRLMIGANGDGAIYAMKIRTGEMVWKFDLSKRGVNPSVVVDGTMVCTSHSEENIDEATMGRLVCIDGTGTGDITSTNELWRVDGLEAGYASPAIHDGHLYVMDNSGNLYDFDSRSGTLNWKRNIGTVGKGSPVWADGKLYTTEVNGTFAILSLSDPKNPIVEKDHVTVKGARPAEIYGSPAIAYNRIYFTSEEGIYCLGDKTAKFHASPAKPVLLLEQPPSKDAIPAWIQIRPAEVHIQPGDKVQFEARAYDEKGRFLRVVSATWDAGDAGTIDNGGNFVAGNRPQGSEISAQVGSLTGKARVRIVPNIPFTEDFESTPVDKNPTYWVGAFNKFLVRDLNGNKVLVKGVPSSGLLNADTYFGTSEMKGYTIQADVMGAKVKRKMPDIGIQHGGYILNLLGNYQELQILTWPSELRINQEVDFEWSPDTWYVMKLRVDIQGGKGLIRGKVWAKSDPEPEKWTIEAEDPNPIPQGTPGIFGSSPAEIFYDNIKVTANEG